MIVTISRIIFVLLSLIGTFMTVAAVQADSSLDYQGI